MFTYAIIQADTYRDEQFTDSNAKVINATCEQQNEWDSDIDDSNSSEEFMYVRNRPATEVNSNTAIGAMAIDDYSDNPNGDDESDISAHQYNPSSSVWNSHEDKVQIISKGKDNHPLLEDQTANIAIFKFFFQAMLMKKSVNVSYRKTVVPMLKGNGFHPHGVRWRNHRDQP